MNQKIIARQELISSSEASLLSGYSTEYIARLCRRGDIEARRVGRAWYVVDASLKQHLLKRDGVIAEDTAAPLAQNFLPADQAGKSVGYSGDYVSKLCREGAISCSKVGRVWHAQVESLRQFEGLQSAKIEEKKLSLTEVRRKEYQDKQRARKIFEVVTGRSFVTFFAKQGIMGSFAIALFVLATAFGSVQLQHNRLIERVGDAASTAAASVYGIGHLQEVQVANTMDSLAKVDGSSVKSESLGMVVLPGSDAKGVENIKESFSDEVVVSQKDSTTGVITPVFKNSEGEEYLYLMVPIDQSNTQSP